MAISVYNPATGDLLKSYTEMEQGEVSQILDEMVAAREAWAKQPFSVRSDLMRRAAQVIRDNLDEYAQIITKEMGKPISQALGEMRKCADLCDFYAEEAPKYVVDETVETDKHKSMRCYRPLGIIFAIMPWNFPFWQVLRFAVPNLMVGNAGLLKHAPNSTAAALAIEDIFIRAGFPAGLFRSLVIDVDLCSYVIAHPAVAGVTLTGSNGAGSAVGSQAAKHWKKAVLELGGSDPYVVLADANVDQAAAECVASRLANAGQICISAKRLIVVDAVYDEFVSRVQAHAEAYQCGDPMDPETTVGPMARDDLRDELARQVEQSIAAGATCLRGGHKIEGRAGYYYEPTILVDVAKGMPAYDQELFGPVVSIIRVADEAEAIRVANDSHFGLGGCVFTEDLARGEDIAANHIETGTCNVNCRVSSSFNMPFGGIKHSGYGRELSREGVREFMNVKSVNVARF